MTAKLLNTIISADKKDTIRIDYQPMVQYLYTNSAMSMVQDNNTIPDLEVRLPSGYNYVHEEIVPNYTTYITMVPKNIYFSGGRMTFTSASTGGLEYIKIYDKKNALVKQFQLVKTSLPFGLTYQGLLSELRLQDANGTTVEKYSFEYHQLSSSYQADYLGYIKNNGMHVFRETISFTSTLSKYTNDFGFGVEVNNGGYQKGLGTTTSYASDETSIGGMLKKVTYPTGGSAEYDYELNKFPLGSSGGMRLAQAKLTDNNGNVHYKTYKYGTTGEEGNGAWKFGYVSDTWGPSPSHTAYERRVFPTWQEKVTYVTAGLAKGQSYRRRVYTSSFLPEIAEAAQEAQAYPTVTVYDGTPTNNTGKTVYKYHYNGSKYLLYQFPTADWSIFIAYRVAHFGVDAGRFAAPEEFDPALNYRSHITEFHPWKSYPLESTTVYKNNGNGYDPVKSLVNTYNVVETQRFKGLHVVKNVDIATVDVDIVGLRIPIFLYDNYYITNGREDLTSTTETLYTPGGNLVTTTSYEYNGNHQVSKATMTSSSGANEIKTFSYPAEQGSTQPYVKMVDNNVISPVIEEKIYKTSTSNFLQGTKTEYGFFNANGKPTDTVINAIYPKLVSTKKGIASYEPRLDYLRYTSGNVAEVSKTQGQHISYLYDKLKINPVAQVTNANLNNIFYESFEEGAGNSALDDSRTGHYSSTSGISKTLTGLDAGSYTLSYWKKTGTTWGLIVNTVTVLTNTYNVNLTGQIDDVRFYPSNAQMVTFTYDPLIGQTSATDAKNEVTYYQYDSYGRLKSIKDKDKNIVKSFCYNYKGQLTDCFLPETVAPVSIYAKIDKTNYSVGHPGNPDGEYWVNNSYTMTIKFYADAACTIPYTLTTGMTVNVNNNYEIYHDMLGNSDYGQYAYTYNVQSGVSSYSMGTQMISARHHYYDPYSEMYWDDYYNYDYEIIANSGNNYVPVN